MSINSGNSDDFVANPKKYLGSWADDSVLLGYFVEDEPGVEDGKASDWIVKHADALHRMDPYHPTFISSSVGWDRFYAYSPVVDVTGAHVYPAWLRYNEQLAAEATRMVHRAAQGKRPVWMTVQPFYFKNNRIHPTTAEFRHMIYSTLVNGATGLGFWGVSDRPGFDDEDIRGMMSVRPLWQELKQILPAVHRLSPVLMSQEPVDATVISDNEAVTIMTKRWEGKLYIWALNMTKSKTNVVLTLPVKEGELVNQIRPVGAFPVKDGRCKLELEALQPLVLCLERLEM